MNRTFLRIGVIAAVAAPFAVLAACGSASSTGSGPPDSGTDSGTEAEAGAAVPDAAPDTFIADAGFLPEASPAVDAGDADAAAAPDGGDAGADADASDGAAVHDAADAGDAAEAGPSPATVLSVGLTNSCAVTASGNVLCWSGAAAPVAEPTLIGDVATVSAGGEGIGFSGDGFFDCAVTTAGALWCWGQNANGQLGNGSTTTSAVPTPASTLTSGVISVSAGSGEAGGSTCAVTSDGNVWCWGYNGNGELGNGTALASSPVPVELAGFTGGATAVSMGINSACAITTGGGVMCWGTNGNGQLGNNATASSLAPVQVMGLTSGATAISVANVYACAVVSGGVECWGNNGFGQNLVPTAVAGLGSGVTSVSVGTAPASDSACAVVNGAVECWGSNATGQLGNGSTTNSAVPVAVSTLTSGVTAVSMGFGTACALTSVGGVWCWGAGFGTMPLRVTGFPQ